MTLATDDPSNLHTGLHPPPKGLLILPLLNRGRRAVARARTVGYT